jgi:hypoxanthine-guanine phosphoribosyltransferase
MNNNVDEYLSLTKEIAELKKVQSQLRKRQKELEDNIKEYLEKNQLTSISTSDGTEIFLSDRKIPQTFKKDIVMNKLTEKLTRTKLNDTSVEDLAESILKNDVYILEKTVKCKKKTK